MAQRSKFIGAPSRNEFWEPQEGRQQRVVDENRLCERSKVAVNIVKSCFKQRCAEKSTLEAESRNLKITDGATSNRVVTPLLSPHQRTHQKVSGDFCSFGPQRKRAFCFLCRSGQRKSHRGSSGVESGRQMKLDIGSELPPSAMPTPPSRREARGHYKLKVIVSSAPSLRELSRSD